MRQYAEANDLGLVLTAPVGVRLPGQEVPVEPDILFVANQRSHIVGDKYIEGAPDLVVEVLSPSNWLYDRSIKQEAYRLAGVLEYWLVDYRQRIIDVLVLEGAEYVLQGQYRIGDEVISAVLRGFQVAVADVFAR
jgi:Uma2 family endonuclease